MGPFQVRLPKYFGSQGDLVKAHSSAVCSITMFLQFPDDVTYENRCGMVEVNSQSRIGGSDFGVNSDRLDDLEEFLQSYDFKTTCQ